VSKIVFRLFRALGIIFGFGVIILYTMQFYWIISNNGFQSLNLKFNFTSFRDTASLAFGIILVLPFSKFKSINPLYKNIIFIFLIVFEVYLCAYYIFDFESDIPLYKEDLITITVALLEILIALSNIYIFFCEVMKKDTDKDVDNEVMSELFDS